MPETMTPNVIHAARTGQLECHFQPIALLADGRFSALEARVRWQLGGETLGAADALALAARQGELRTLDLNVIQLAIDTFLQAPVTVRSDLRLAINISTETALGKGFVESLDRIFDVASLKPEQIRLELPAAAFERDAPRARQIVEHLHAKGLRVAVDHVVDEVQLLRDLEGLPLDAVKLDESLTARLPNDIRACETLSQIVSTARRLGIETGAEGIARIDQLDCLRGVGCTEGQGMLICRPNPINSLRFLLERRRCW